MKRLLMTAAGPAGIVAVAVSAVFWAVSGIATAALAQENPLLGAWTAVDSGTGMEEVLTVTPEEITFGAAAPPIPYRLERDGDGLAVYFADSKDPARFTFLDNANAQLSVPGGPTIALKRQDAAATGSEGAAAESGQVGVIEAAAAALLPQGDAAPSRPGYDPRDPSLQGLLAEGWQLDQVNGSTSGLTLLMRNGGRHALCILAPRETDAASSAVTDCRRLN